MNRSATDEREKPEPDYDWIPGGGGCGGFEAFLVLWVLTIIVLYKLLVQG